MSFEINTLVRLLEDIPSEGVCSGDLGVIVAVYSVPEEAYEVEFCDKEGVTVTQVPLTPLQFKVCK